MLYCYLISEHKVLLASDGRASRMGDCTGARNGSYVGEIEDENKESPV